MLGATGRGTSDACSDRVSRLLVLGLVSLGPGDSSNAADGHRSPFEPTAAPYALLVVVACVVLVARRRRPDPTPAPSRPSLGTGAGGVSGGRRRVRA
jgi:hypothetical protein